MAEYILEMKNISKSFPGVKALDKVQLQIRRGEVHALMGENGAGKSTLMKILNGLYRPDGGEIFFDGKRIQIDNPVAALKAGVSMIHQELSPICGMSIAENIFLGREPLYSYTPFVKKRELHNKVADLLDRFNMKLNPDVKLSQLSIAQMQMIEIIKAVSYNARIILMDEPTSALTEEEVKKLFNTISELKQSGIPIVYISHRMEEIFKIADRVSVLRDGKYIGTKDTADLTENLLISMMVGRELKSIFSKEEARIGDTVLEVRNLNRKDVFYDISFKVRKGEILGIAGLMGAGRSEVMRAIFGIDHLDSGEILFNGIKIGIKKPSDAINHGIAMVTEDRKELGLVACRSIKENISLPSIKALSKCYFIKKSVEKTQCNEITKEISVKMKNINQIVQFLSGGNQQKVVLAKWLVTKPKLLILDEPTRGIDVGAKAEIHKLMSILAGEGMAIIMISSELPEIMGMSDRIIVMGDGRIKGEFSRGEVTQEELLGCAIGGEA